MDNTDDSFLKHLSSPLGRFQMLILESTSKRINAGQFEGPTWEKFVANDYSLGSPPEDLTTDGELLRYGMDIIAALRQLGTCRLALIEEGRRRYEFPTFDRAEIFITAHDAIVYRLYERMNKFFAHTIIAPANLRIKKSTPKIIETIKGRRGRHTHEFDQRLLDSSSTVLALALIPSPEDQREQIRKVIFSEMRRTFRKRINEQVAALSEIEDAAFKWVNAAFKASEPQWTAYLKHSSNL